MFNNLKKSLLGLKSTPVKVVASSNFLDVMTQINKAKEVVEVKEENKDLNFKNLLLEATSLLKHFCNTNYFDSNTFNEISDILLEAIKLKPSEADPYYYLAWLFNYIQDNATAIKYLKIVAAINPKYDGLEELRQQISETINFREEKTDEQKLEEKTVTVQPKAVPQSNVSTKPPPNPNANKLNAYKAYKAYNY